MLSTVTVDVGTTSVKLCLFDAEGALRASARQSTPTVNDAWGEVYDVDALRDAIVSFVAGLEHEARAGVRRLSITGVGESGGLVRPDVSLASPMILWHDHRGADALSALSETDRELVYSVTGLPVNANYGLSKVAWAVAHHETGGDAQWLNIAEYLAAWLTGQRWSEYSLASRTMALDLQSGTWSPEVCALLGLDVALFPELRSAISGVPLTVDAARLLDVASEVRVHVAGHDHMVGAVGAGLQRGELLNSTGTTEGLLFLRKKPSLNQAAVRAKLANGIACSGGDYTLFASIPTGGSAFATLQGLLGLSAGQVSASLERAHESYLAGTIDYKSTPLVLPRFRGSPPPTKDARARGVIANLQSDTTADDLVLGTFLGMALQFRDVLELFPDAPTSIKVIGPASSNPLWLQLKADLLNMPLSASRFPEVVSRGAQALASGTMCAWSDSEPRDVVVNEERAARLMDWSADVRPQWEYLKGVPV